MNILFTAVANFLTLESKACLSEWRARLHIVEQMPMERIVGYLRFEPASALALVDAIVCMADSDRIALATDRPMPILDFPLQKAIRLATDVRNLPETCTMRDGRKWRSIPFVIFSGRPDYRSYFLKLDESHARVFRSTHPVEALRKVQDFVDEYHDRVLDGYHNLGILVRSERGRHQIGPALMAKSRHAESEYYYAAGDRRSHTDWVTVKRDSEGIRQDVELFQMLLDRRASESEMHRFFEEHPAILMEARLGIPISHRPRFTRPQDNTPDFSFTPILGPLDDRAVELMELKGPGEKTLTRGPHPGFTAKVHRAVDQVRDYDRYLRDPKNIQAVLRGLGYLPDDSKLAVLIGRAPREDADREVWAQRQRVLDVKVVTYDEILAKQSNQLSSGAYRVKSGTPGYPIN